MLNPSPICLILCAFAVDVQAAPSTFEETAFYASGAGNIAPFHGGQYVYKTPQDDGRAVVPAMLTGAVERQVVEFFSAEEEQALLNFKNQQLAQAVKKKVVVQRVAHATKTQDLHWPKVVVRGNEVCVPELVNSESADWKDHLTCYEGAAP